MAMLEVRDSTTEGTLAVISGTANKEFACSGGFHPNRMRTIKVFRNGDKQVPNTILGAADYEYELGQLGVLGKVKLETALDIETEVLEIYYYPIGGTIS